MSGKIAALKSIGILFLYLIAGLLTIILCLSAVSGWSPFDFFVRIRTAPAINVIYIVLLYFLILTAVRVRARQDGLDGICSYGLSKTTFDGRTVSMAAVSTVLLMICYFVLLSVSGAGRINLFSVTTLSLLAQGIIFGSLFSLVEEVFFRGFILQTLLRGFSPAGAFIGAAALFALLHLFRPGGAAFKGVYFTGLFLLAIVLSYAWYKTRSLWVPMAIHTVLIAGMYVISSGVVFNPDRYKSLAVLLGLDFTPVAGIAGIAMLGMLLGIIARSKPFQPLTPSEDQKAG